MKTTDKLPFSNGTEYMIWFDRNCAKCKKYEPFSTEREKAGCKIAFDIDLAQITGEIPESSINAITDKNGNLMNCIYKYFIPIKKLNLEIFKQLKLF